MSVARALVWVAEGTWEACVDQAAAILPQGCEITLLHVDPPDALEAAAGAAAGLLGRGRRPGQPADELAGLARRAADELLDAARARLGRDAAVVAVTGRAEREVLSAAADADLLVLARDGDPARPGPHSIGPATRFVVDHAACAVLLVWMAGAPHRDELPPEPRHGPRARRGTGRAGPPPPPPPRG